MGAGLDWDRSAETDVVGTAHPTGMTRLKLWAFRTLKNTISNILSDRFTHSFSLVTPLHFSIINTLMLDREKILNTIYKIDSLHLEDPSISIYWDELNKLLSEDKKETIDFLDSCNDENVINNISSVFDDISIKLQSQDFIQCLDRLEVKFSNLFIHHMIEVARDSILS